MSKVQKVSLGTLAAAAVTILMGTAASASWYAIQASIENRVEVRRLDDANRSQDQIRDTIRTSQAETDDGQNANIAMIQGQVFAMSGEIRSISDTTKRIEAKIDNHHAALIASNSRILASLTGDNLMDAASVWRGGPNPALGRKE